MNWLLLAGFCLPQPAAPGRLLSVMAGSFASTAADEGSSISSSAMQILAIGWIQ
jgi:hypothetical protein